MRETFFLFRPRRKTKTLMKKDKYPLAGGLMPGADPSRGVASSGPGGNSTRDMYSSMNGSMPNGYSAYDPGNMYAAQSAYGNGSIYGRYDSMYGSTMSSYMNGSYAAMYGAPGAPQGAPGGGGGNSSPYGSSMPSMSPVGHPSHSPGSVKSESGSNSHVAMPQGSPASGYNLKREVSPPPVPGGGPPPPQQDLNRMISMYLPGDAAAAAAGDPNAQSRIQSMYAGHYQAMVGHHHLSGASPDHLVGHHAMSMAHM